MKTLDEVIKAKELCELNCSDEGHCQDCPYAKQDANGDWSFFCQDCEADALHYLKEYRSEKAMWEADRKGHLDWIEQYKESREKHQQAVIELKKNPPLDWDELKQMEGKPVWFEVTDPKALPALDSGWGIVGCTSFTTWEGVESFSLVKVGVTYAVPIAQYGRAWNVYRKERK